MIHWCCVCQRAYRLHSYSTVENHDLCPGCRAAAEQAVDAPDTEEQKRKRAERFGVPARLGEQSDRKGDG